MVMDVRPLRAIAFLESVIRLLRRTRGKLLTIEEIKTRLDICVSCDYYHGDRCELCGCCVGSDRTFFNKIAYPTESCPHDPPKWERTV
jgi:hypothetical protein